MDKTLTPEAILVDVIALSKKICSTPISGNLAYATEENFLGRIVDGYNDDARDICLLTQQAAHSLCDVQNDLNKKQLGLYIYDAYRPLSAVKDFANWFHQPVAGQFEIDRKKIHYPNIQKTDLVPLGYAPNTVSRHNFGNAVDLTLIDIETSCTIEMGACFDYFDELSHNTVTSDQISEEAYNNRIILINAMQIHGFIPYEKEFWHFDYHIREANNPIDIPIVKELKGLNVN